MSQQVQTDNVQTLSKTLECELDPVLLFEALVENSETSNRMLLESCRIDNKQHLKSILVHRSALRIECLKNQIIIQSLTSNGDNALAQVKNDLSNQSDLTLKSSGIQLLTVTYPELSDIEHNLNEEQRLRRISPIDCLRKINTVFESQNRQAYSNFLCGLFSFDFIATFEKLPDVANGKNTCPDFVFYLAEELVVIDHETHHSVIYSNIFLGENSDKNYYEQSRRIESLTNKILEASLKKSEQRVEKFENLPVNKEYLVDCNMTDGDYQETVRTLKDEIIKGNIFQVVPSRTFSLPCTDTIGSYQKLKQNNPSPYMFYMRDQDFILFGASPESALKYQQDASTVELYPIAGTRPRGKLNNGQIDEDLDKRLEAELKLDQKEISEHMMLVDLARNDIARISNSCSVKIPRLLEVDRYSQVMHLVSHVQGTLRNDLDCFHAYQACMNMGTLTGAPKIKASELIRQTEKTRRGSYGGAVGYINANGDMDTCIVIRSAFCKNNIAYIQAGAGVVFDSDPQSESEETINKAKAVINAIQLAHSAEKG